MAELTIILACILAYSANSKSEMWILPSLSQSIFQSCNFQIRILNMSLKHQLQFTSEHASKSPLL